jgi:hypothetical protein
LEIAELLVAGGIGAVSAIAAQYLGNRSAERRHKRDLGQRDTQMWLQFMTPISGKRVEAAEDIWDIVQQAIDTKKLDLNEYEIVRKQSLYLPGSLSTSLMRHLSDLLRAVRSGDNALADTAVTQLKRLQTQIRETVKLTSLETMLENWQTPQDIGERHES